MSPYRQSASVEEQLGPKWGATRWAKFWVKHRALEWIAVWSLILLVVIPLNVVAWPFTGKHPLDF